MSLRIANTLGRAAAAAVLALSAADDLATSNDEIASRLLLKTKDVPQDLLL